MIQLSDFYGYSMYTISSDTLSVSVMSLGATVTRLAYQGRNVVVSLKTPDDYLQDTSYLGAIVGRYANRIAVVPYGTVNVPPAVFGISEPSSNLY